MTNYEKIKAITVEELAIEMIDLGHCRYCIYDIDTCSPNCKDGSKKFLESEVK